MKRSTDRILTTHAGSLPQPHNLAEMLAVKDTGQPYDQEAFAQRLRSAIAEVVHKQTVSGIDLPDSYATEGTGHQYLFGYS